MLFFVLLLGCAGSEVVPDDSQDSLGDPPAGNAWKWFDMSTPRVWEFQAEDEATPYMLIARNSDGPVEVTDDGRGVYEIEFTAECRGVSPPCDDADGDGVTDFEAEPVMVWRISSNAASGAALHQMDGDVFDPPISLATPSMKAGQSVQTVVEGGVNVTSTMGQEIDVDVLGTDSPCRTWSLDGIGSPVQGDYTMSMEYGFVEFDMVSQPSAWLLISFEQR